MVPILLVSVLYRGRWEVLGLRKNNQKNFQKYLEIKKIALPLHSLLEKGALVWNDDYLKRVSDLFYTENNRNCPSEIFLKNKFKNIWRNEIKSFTFAVDLLVSRSDKKQESIRPNVVVLYKKTFFEILLQEIIIFVVQDKSPMIIYWVLQKARWMIEREWKNRGYILYINI